MRRVRAPDEAVCDAVRPGPQSPLVMSLGQLAYALACVVVPMLWGVAVVWAANRIESRVNRRLRDRGGGRRRDVPPIEYHI